MAKGASRKPPNACQWPHCRSVADQVIFGVRICTPHWYQYYKQKDDGVPTSIFMSIHKGMRRRFAPAIAAVDKGEYDPETE